MAEKISFEAPRGMRDFYPEDMLWRNKVFDAFRAAGEAAGFEPYDSCVVESYELLARKAGEEVGEQIYHFFDKSERHIALRAEMTPTLARMVAQRQKELSFPIKWTTIAQCFRYERMTKGRKREHYQWNVDIIGEDALLAHDVEVPLVVLALAALRHALVAEALRDRRPLEREGKLLLALRDHSRKRRRHLGAKGEMALGLVEKVVNLLADFLARLAGKELVALDDARIVLTETRRLSRGAKRVENAAAPRHVLGIEVPHSARRLKTDLVCHRSVLS